MRALGTTDVDFLADFLTQLGGAASKGPDPDKCALNFMLAVVKGIDPKDQVEAMLGAQMAAVHMATMKFACRLTHVDNIQQQDSAERVFNKLARTFAAQVEALKRCRTGGEQKVTVKHVTVNEGGQAIVGNVSTGGRANEKVCEQPHAKLIADASQPPMRSADEEGERVQITGNAERPVPNARRNVSRRT
jgi:hypothetical protein